MGTVAVEAVPICYVGVGVKLVLCISEKSRNDRNEWIGPLGSRGGYVTSK